MIQLRGPATHTSEDLHVLVARAAHPFVPHFHCHYRSHQDLVRLTVGPGSICEGAIPHKPSTVRLKGGATSPWLPRGRCWHARPGAAADALIVGEDGLAIPRQSDSTLELRADPSYPPFHIDQPVPTYPDVWGLSRCAYVYYAIGLSELRGCAGPSTDSTKQQAASKADLKTGRKGSCKNP